MCTSSIIPTRFLIASPCQLPASRPAPGLHPRKSAGRGKNPFLFAMLFEKNIEIFSDPNPSVLCVFSICLPPFRGWTGAGSAGGYNAPGLPEIEGTWSGWNIMSIAGGENAGAFQSHWEAAGSIASATKEAGVWDRLLIKASRSNPLYGSSTTVMPASVNLPVILYLGISA